MGYVDVTTSQVLIYSSHSSIYLLPFSFMRVKQQGPLKPSTAVYKAYQYVFASRRVLAL